tara:strand:+ start:787 stop:1014 length:228 start_codon:yes stop_codon:yes gene_type:complete
MRNKFDKHAVIKKRLRIYENIKKKIDIYKDFDVVFNTQIKSNSLNKLKLATINYVVKCLELQFKKKFYKKKKFFI